MKPTKTFKFTASILFTTLLAACAVGPRYHAPTAATPSGWRAWHGGDASLATAQWRQDSDTLALKWSDTFNDATLRALLERANAQSSDLQIATLRFAQARAQSGGVAAQRGPQLNANANANRQAQSENGASTRVINAMGLPETQKQKVLEFLAEPFNLYQAGFDASWEIDLWGRVRHSIEAAKANEAAAQALLNQVRISTNAEIMRQYFELKNTQTQLRLTRAQLQTAERSTQWLNAKFKGGLLDQVEPARAQINVDELQNNVTQLVAQEAQRINQITLLVGDAPGSWNSQLTDQGNSPHRAALPRLDMGLPAQLAQRRPDIVQAQAQFQAAVANTGVAVADLYPRITLGANLGQASISGGTFFDITSLQWAIGPSLSIPIFDMGRRRSVITLRELQQQEAAINYQTAALKAWHEVDTLLSQYTADGQREQQIADKVKQAQNLLDLTAARFKGGLVDELPVLDAKRNALQMQQQLANVSTQRQTDLIALYKALGGNDWSLPDGQTKQVAP